MYKTITTMLLLMLSFQVDLFSQNTDTDKIETISKALNKKYPLNMKKWTSGRINGKSFIMRDVNAKLSFNGNFNISAVQTTNRLQGWTGRLIFEIQDKRGNVLATIYTPSTGINGKRLFAKKENRRNINHALNLKSYVKGKEYATLMYSAYRIVPKAERAGKGLKRIVNISSDLKAIAENMAEPVDLVVKAMAAGS